MTSQRSQQSTWAGMAALLAVAILLWVDLIEVPSRATHLELELGAALLAIVAFAWVLLVYVRRDHLS